jgi:hypothetical protein
VGLRNLGLFGALLLALLPAPAQAQGDFIKDTVKDLIQKSGIYLSTSTRTSIDNDVSMDPTWGVGYGTAGSKQTGVKYPFSYSSYRGHLETAAGDEFGQFKAQQIMSGIGYQWVRGKMVYGVQLGLGYSFNRVTVSDAAVQVFNTGGPPVYVTVSNSFVVRPKLQAEYFVHPKISFRTQLGYTYTDPDVVVQTPTTTLTREWHPHHVQLNVGIGFFPFRK